MLAQTNGAAGPASGIVLSDQTKRTSRGRTRFWFLQIHEISRLAAVGWLEAVMPCSQAL